MIQETISKLKCKTSAIEQMIGPVLVFAISYVHHLYFANDLVSPCFAGFAVAGLLLVMAFEQLGLLAAIFLQLCFIGWVAIARPPELMQQLVFSFSLVIAFVASYLNADPVSHTVEQAPLQASGAPQKDKLWEELFDARQEIKTLYHEKQELEATSQSRIQEALHEKNERILYLEHHLEALTLEKEHLVEERQAAEEDIKKLIDDMHHMAQKREEKPEAPYVEPAIVEASKAVPIYETSPYESLYRQLKVQFEEKSNILDTTRKELFLTHEELERIRRLHHEPNEASPEERHLMASLDAREKQIEELKRAHDEELIGYEEVIQGLLQQLHDKQ